jgi:DNA repair photolyase
MPSPSSPRGRGAAFNPVNRFESVWLDADWDGFEGVPADERPAPQTQVLFERAKTILAHNNSPDIGFDTSINAYRGCEHGCIYCLDGETRILMGDGSTKALARVAVGDEIYGTERRGWYRHYVKTRVLAHWRTVKPVYRVTLADNTTLLASGDHRFLTERGWKFVTGTMHGMERRPHLTTSNALMGTGAFSVTPEATDEYRQGYLCGMIRGDGHLNNYEYSRVGRGHGNQWQFRLALKDGEALQRSAEYLQDFGIQTRPFVFQQATNNTQDLNAIRTHARSQVENIQCLIQWPRKPTREWQRGFLAGIFDAEGSNCGGVFRITNSDTQILAATDAALKEFGFRMTYDVECQPKNRVVKVIRLQGGLREQLKFFHTVAPAIARKLNLEGRALKSSCKLGVVEIKPLGEPHLLYDITTGTGDFIANGVVSHNCYARPTHEYLGYSSGLDFETKIVVKENASELLRKELSAKGWKPRTVSMSGVTDCYQPLERRFELSRRCLEVFLDFRNPVVAITKNHLITRDMDLLQQLAAFNAVSVCISLTTLVAELARKMEPRASIPSRRLAAVEQLSQAGVPVGVLVCPIIPGLTDHEIPAILNAAAKAGAAFAGYNMIALPYANKELFETWLTENYPARAEKVLSKIRQVRGGKLYDADFGQRMTGSGLIAEQINSFFKIAKRKSGIPQRGPKLSVDNFRVPTPGQYSLFDK